MAINMGKSLAKVGAIMADMSKVPEQIQQDLEAVQTAFERNNGAIADVSTRAAEVAAANANYNQAVANQQASSTELHDSLNKLTQDIVSYYNDNPPAPVPNKPA